MSSHEEFYTTQHVEIVFDSFIRNNPVAVHSVLTVDKTGDVDEVILEKVYLKSSKGYSPDITMIQLDIDGLGSWNIDREIVAGVYKDVTQQLEGEAYDKYMETR